MNHTVLRWFVQTQVRKQVLDLWSWLGNIPFYMPGKILVIQERARFHTFLCLVSYVTNKCASADDLHIHMSLPHLSVCKARIMYLSYHHRIDSSVLRGRCRMQSRGIYHEQRVSAVPCSCLRCSVSSRS